MPRPSNRPSDSQLAEAYRREKIGVPLETIAADLGISRRSLQRYLADFEPDPADAELNPDGSLSKDATALGISDTLSVEAQRAELTRIANTERELADKLAAEGELDQSRKHRDLQLKSLNVLRALNKGNDPNAIVITREQMATVRQQARDKMLAARKARPLCCSRCSVALSAEWALEASTGVTNE